MAKTFTYKSYTDDAATKAAKKKVTQLESQKPSDFQYADYSSQYTGMSEDIMNQYLNRDKFSYDINGDALYQQYKDQYINQGQQAMMDTMGQAAALTGGYGNSYAQSVGQQTYQGYLQQLNDKIPELYQLALDQYNREGDELLNKYGMVTDADDRAYNRWSEGYDRAYGQHRDSVADWQYEYGMANDNYWNAKNFGYGVYSDNKNLAFEDFWNGQNYDQTETWNQKNYDQTENWNQKDFDLALKQLAEETRQFDLEYELQKKNSVSSSSSNNNNYAYTPQEDDTEDDTPKGDTPDYNSIYDDCNAYIASGASRSNISTYIRNALTEGYISQAEYNKLKETFLPSGSSGSGGRYAY